MGANHALHNFNFNIGNNMLKTAHKENDVVSLKLSTGEEIVGYFISSDGIEVVIRKPLSLIATQEGAGFAPFMITSDTMASTVSFSKSNIVTMMATASHFADPYTKQMSGLDMSESKKSGLIL